MSAPPPGVPSTVSQIEPYALVVGEVQTLQHGLLQACTA
jgi:hypothetical protein